MVGFTESLNISVSAAIIIQNLTNRLQFKHWLALIRKFFGKAFGLGQNSIKISSDWYYFEENPQS
jgi:tRNA (guanosine-2'-O-)-methyltransferase